MIIASGSIPQRGPGGKPPREQAPGKRQRG